MRAVIIHKTDENGENPLFKAAKTGDLAEVKRLANEGCIYAYNSTRTTPLMIAAKGGFVSIVEFFLSPEYAEREIVKSQINYQSTKGYTAFMYALHRGDTLLQLLIDNGADDQLVNKEGSTPFILAAGLGNINALNLLYARKPENLNRTNFLGGSALAMATQNGHLNCVQYLLALGAAYRVLESGFSPLIAAIQNGHVELALYFLSDACPAKTVVVEHINSYQEKGSALLWATNLASDTKSPHHADLVQSLLKAGAKQLRNQNGVTPLMVAAEISSAELTSLFLQDPDCDINQTESEFGRSALFIATVYSAHDVMSLLLIMGATHQATHQGTTPLIRAALDNNLETVEILLLSKPGPEVINAVDNQGKSAWSIASQNKNDKIMAALNKALVKAGAKPNAQPDARPHDYNPTIFPTGVEADRAGGDKSAIELRSLMQK